LKPSIPLLVEQAQRCTDCGDLYFHKPCRCCFRRWKRVQFDGCFRCFRTTHCSTRNCYHWDRTAAVPGFGTFAAAVQARFEFRLWAERGPGIAVDADAGKPEHSAGVLLLLQPKDPEPEE